MENQRGKEGMKTATFNAAVGATAGCTLRLLLDSIPEDDKGKKHGIRGDAWFGSVRAASEIARRGHKAVFQIKQNHSLYTKAFIEEALKEAPEGVHIVLEGMTQCEIPLIAIGYHYSRKTILFFLLTKGAGSAINDVWEYCNPFCRPPSSSLHLFRTSNAIDTHNQLCKDLLQLEKKWLTMNPYFCLPPTLLGINVTDTFLLANNHKLINSGSGSHDEKKISIQRFAGILSFQLLRNAKELGCSRLSFMSEEILPVQKSLVSDLSSPTISGSVTISDKPVAGSLVDANGKTHYLVKFDVTKDPSGYCRTKKRKCKRCLEEKKRQDVSFFCITCGESFSFCSNIDGRDCFKQHVKGIKRVTRHTL